MTREQVSKYNFFKFLRSFQNTYQDIRIAQDNGFKKVFVHKKDTGYEVVAIRVGLTGREKEYFIFKEQNNE